MRENCIFVPGHCQFSKKVIKRRDAEKFKKNIMHIVI